MPMDQLSSVSTQAAEPVRMFVTEQTGRDHREDIEHEREQPEDRDDTGYRLQQRLHHETQLRHHRYQPQQPEHAQDGERATGRNQRDADDHEVETAPRIAEERHALTGQLDQDLEHEDPEDDPVGELQLGADRGHHGR